MAFKIIRTEEVASEYKLSIEQETLTDGSKVYNVHMQQKQGKGWQMGPVTFHPRTRWHADALFVQLREMIDNNC